MNQLKTTDFIQNGKLTKLGVITLICALSQTTQKVFETITNENKLKDITTKQN